MIIGGIRYDVHSLAGSVDGAHCEECVEEMIRQIRVGQASVVFPVESPTAVMRFDILKRIHLLDARGLLPGAWREFLLTGNGAPIDSGVAARQIGYTTSSTANNAADYNLRYAMVYLNEYVRNPLDRHTLNTYRQYMAALSALEAPAPFVCRDCNEVIDVAAQIRASRHLHPGGSLDGAATPNVCASCLADNYTWCEYQLVYANDDTETVEVRGINGFVTREYAATNYRFVEEEDEDGDPIEDQGYWTAERVMPRDTLLGYGANPFDQFSWDKRNKPNALVFGVELEMEPNCATEDGQRAIINALGGSVGKNFILKSDGSLDEGVELVTMPFTLSQHLDNSGVPWKAVCDSVRDIARSGAGTGACGIHIHINKKALSALTIGKMLVFLNDPGLAPLITTIAQRASGSFCQRSAKKLTDGVRNSENRYDIMNVSVRHPTCEIRMFRGNITVERIYKNIEFCHALIQYCRQASMRTLTDWGNFSAWLIAHRGTYQNLVRFLIDSKTVGFRQLARDTRDGQVTIKDR